MHPDYLEKVLNAQVYDIAVETPLELAANLSSRAGNKILLKREDMQPVFSFKLRGAYNKIASLSPEKLKRGVICASAGNHAQGVAMSAAKLGCRAVIVMPESTPGIKIDAVKRRGGEVVLAGASYDDAYAKALELEKSEKLTFVHPFDDPDVIAGQGTIGLEILRQHSRHNGPIHAVFCAIGGGGLAAGVAAYIKRLRPEVKVIGVETFDADAMKQSLAAGKRVRLNQVGLFADGTAVKFVGEETFRLCKEYLDDVILVDTDAICATTTYENGDGEQDARKEYHAERRQCGWTTALLLVGKWFNERHDTYDARKLHTMCGCFDCRQNRMNAARMARGESSDVLVTGSKHNFPAAKIPENPAVIKAIAGKAAVDVWTPGE